MIQKQFLSLYGTALRYCPCTLSFPWKRSFDTVCLVIYSPLFWLPTRVAK